MEIPRALLPSAGCSDERLAAFAACGDARAFDVLYRRHRRELLRYCRSLVRDPDDAEDTLQTAMTKAYAAIRRLPADVPVRAWLFRIAYNEAVTTLRRRRPVTPLDAVEAVAAQDVERR